MNPEVSGHMCYRFVYAAAILSIYYTVARSPHTYRGTENKNWVRVGDARSTHETRREVCMVAIVALSSKRNRKKNLNYAL